MNDPVPDGWLYPGISLERELEANLRGSGVAVRIAGRIKGVRTEMPNAFDLVLRTDNGKVLFLSSEDFSILHRLHASGQLEMFPTGVGRDHDDVDEVAQRVIDLICSEPVLAPA
jgi:hypothetical protein